MTVLRDGVARVERLTIAGTNAWLLGDDRECVLVDAPGAADTILAAIGTRRLLGILCTHAHTGHIAAALTVSDATRAPTHLHADDYTLWDQTFAGRWPDRTLADEMTFDVAGVRLHGIHIAGHTDGGMCWYSGELAALFTGDSLSADGPGHGGEPDADYSALESAVRRRLFMLPPDTAVHPGHGPDGRIGTLRWDRELWS